MNDAGDVVATARTVREWRARADAAEVAFLASVDTGPRPNDADWPKRSRPNCACHRERSRPASRPAAMDLTRRMPRVLAAMRSGWMDGYGARRVLRGIAPLSDEHARQVDELLADKLAEAPVSSWQPATLARQVARLVQRVDPGGQTARARTAHQGRLVQLDHGEHAHSRLTIDLRSEVASACYSRVDAMARRLRRGGEQRTLDQLRADLTADLLLGNQPGVTVPEAAARVYVHLPIDAALSMSDTGCELDGYGPIPAPIAREIMTGEKSVWRAVLCDPATGDPVDLGRTRRRPTATMRELVRVRDRECVVPWCHRPARQCDLDHEHEWAAHHGATAVDNTGPRCRRHHTMKNTPGWTSRYDPTRGTTHITTPTGATYTGRREPILTPQPARPARPARSPRFEPKEPPAQSPPHDERPAPPSEPDEPPPF
ncbi:DUF222 domain-containing protein [Prauserella halophila]|nr:HNH endonuclease signature motif containing protein [Prauserella halophila]